MSKVPNGTEGKGLLPMRRATRSGWRTIDINCWRNGLKVYLTDGALIQMRSNNLARAQAEALFYG